MRKTRRKRVPKAYKRIPAAYKWQNPYDTFDILNWLSHLTYRTSLSCEQIRHALHDHIQEHNDATEFSRY